MKIVEGEIMRSYKRIYREGTEYEIYIITPVQDKVYILKNGTHVTEGIPLANPDSHLSREAIEAGATIKTHVNMNGTPFRIGAEKVLHKAWQKATETSQKESAGRLKRRL